VPQSAYGAAVSLVALTAPPRLRTPPTISGQVISRATSTPPIRADAVQSKRRAHEHRQSRNYQRRGCDPLGDWSPRTREHAFVASDDAAMLTLEHHRRRRAAL
jgi:hypothetical protein